MTLPIEHKAGDFYLIKNAPEKPTIECKLNFVCCPRGQCAYQLYESALASCERLKIINVEVTFTKIDYNWYETKYLHLLGSRPVKLEDGQIIDFEGSYEVREYCKLRPGRLAVGCSHCHGGCKDIEYLVFLLPQSEQKTDYNEPTASHGPGGNPDREVMEKSEKEETFTLTIDALFGIYTHGFNHGVNEGPFPKIGTFEAFERLKEGKSPRLNGITPSESFKQMSDRITQPVISSNVIQESDTLDQKIWKLIQATPQFSSNPEDYIKPFRELIKNELESEAVQFADWMMDHMWFNRATDQDGKQTYYQQYTTLGKNRIFKSISELYSDFIKSKTAKLIEDRLFEQGKIMREKNDKISSLESEVTKWRSEALEQARKVDTLTDQNHSLDLELERLKEENNRLSKAFKDIRV